MVLIPEPRSADVSDAVLGAVNDEPVQVLAVPAEGDLQHRVRVGDRDVGGNEQSSPDQC